MSATKLWPNLGHYQNVVIKDEESNFNLSWHQQASQEIWIGKGKQLFGLQLETMRRVTCWTDVTSKAKLGETFIHVHCTHTKSFPSEENVVLIITHRHLLLFNLDDGCSIFVDHSHSCTKALNFTRRWDLCSFGGKLLKFKFSLVSVALSHWLFRLNVRVRLQEDDFTFRGYKTRELFLKCKSLHPDHLSVWWLWGSRHYIHHTRNTYLRRN